MGSNYPEGSDNQYASWTKEDLKYEWHELTVCVTVYAPSKDHAKDSIRSLLDNKHVQLDEFIDE